MAAAQSFIFGAGCDLVDSDRTDRANASFCDWLRHERSDLVGLSQDRTRSDPTLLAALFVATSIGNRLRGLAPLPFACGLVPAGRSHPGSSLDNRLGALSPTLNGLSWRVVFYHPGADIELPPERRRSGRRTTHVSSVSCRHRGGCARRLRDWETLI